MKAWLKGGLILILIFLIIKSIIFVGPIEGVVTDAITGEPLNNVTIKYTILGEHFGGPGGPGTIVFKEKEGIFDNGDYRVPSFFTLTVPVLSWFDGVWIGVEKEGYYSKSHKFLTGHLWSNESMVKFHKYKFALKKKMLNVQLIPKLRKEELNRCDKISNKEIKNECWSLNAYVVAIETNNVLLCDRITSDFSVFPNIDKDMCYQIVYSKIAVKEKNKSICEFIKTADGREYCYGLLAIETKDLSLCEKIHNPTERESCYIYAQRDIYDNAIARTNIALCDEIIEVDWYKGSCYGEIAAKTNNATVCETLLEDLPRDLCYKELASATQDKFFCEKIISPDLRHECTLLVE